MRIQNEINRYCKDVLRAINGSPAYKDRVRNALKCDIELYLSEKPDATIEEIRQHFGEPANYASEATAAMGEKELTRKLRFGKKIFTVVAAGVLAALIMWGCGVAIAVIDQHRNFNGYSTYEITEHWKVEDTP